MTRSSTLLFASFSPSVKNNLFIYINLNSFIPAQDKQEIIAMLSKLTQNQMEDIFAIIRAKNPDKIKIQVS
jgi:hypothetical protein